MERHRHTSDPSGYLIAAVFVAGATAVFYVGREDFAKGQWALLYLLIVGLVAGLRGVRPALLAAVLSFFCWNYFLLPPYGTLHLADPRDWLFLFVFLVVAAVMGLQTGRLRDREAQAQLRALVAQADALREADRLKSTLVSAVSHELKTPLSSLEATMSNLLEQDAPLDQERIREELSAVKLDLDRLSESIESLLDLSRLESSAWGPRLDWYELGEVVGTTLSRLREQERRRVELAIPPGPAADTGRLQPVGAGAGASAPQRARL